MVIYKLYDEDKQDDSSTNDVDIQEPFHFEMGEAHSPRLTERFLSGLWLRFLFLIAWTLCSVYALWWSLVNLGTWFCAVVTFFRFPLLKEAAMLGLRQLKILYTCAMGTFIAIFSPNMGIMFLMTTLIFYSDQHISSGVLRFLIGKFHRYYDS